jgi:hypothetical protein
MTKTKCGVASKMSLCRMAVHFILQAIPTQAKELSPRVCKRGAVLSGTVFGAKRRECTIQDAFQA